MSLLRLLPLLGLVAWAGTALGQEVGLPRDGAAAAGSWDLSLDGSFRRCGLTLAAEAGPVGQAVRFPAGCRRALPLVNGVLGWRYEDGAIQFLDRDGRAVLDFAVPEASGTLSAEAPTGERYNLTLTSARSAPETPTLTPAALTAPPTPREAWAGIPASAAAVAGLYTLDRFVEKDVCRLVLGADSVQVQEGCRDPGLAIFDPAAWHYETGRLTLTARRGHSVALIPVGDGRWRRDPEIGTAFVLRRVTP
ncbi:hypothetical protein OPKNFCMD_3889 [Methylobacterium crusticola]|uniref:Alkaline proteinase inhibitor/ Outer membrane lipoprotein Omp19 domain-containing protein n=1 Tax=Methylobacterium crusticola TaxID=1697972 RepID=A0ABQ4R107_9HYPH|nr:AprI/Inh family metalloprotease inhibitor [Methylobacterium crusticola]GJD51137.1 hypothetical protein OPKNFCMD_3889 [Methylobacterium crusticola]